MTDIEQQKMKILEELIDIEKRIKEMQAARDRQAEEWRKMLRRAMARRSALQDRITSLLPVSAVPPIDPGNEDDEEDEKDEN